MLYKEASFIIRAATVKIGHLAIRVCEVKIQGSVETFLKLLVERGKELRLKDRLQESIVLVVDVENHKVILESTSKMINCSQ